MKKNMLYRVGSVFLAAVMVFTGVPQTELRVYAEEVTEATVAEGSESQTDEPTNTSEAETAPSDAKNDSENVPNPDEDSKKEGETGDEGTKPGEDGDDGSADDSNADGSDTDDLNKDEENKEDPSTPDDSEKEEETDGDETKPGEGEDADFEGDADEGEAAKPEDNEETVTPAEDEEESADGIVVEPENVLQVSGNDLGKEEKQTVRGEKELEGVYQFGDAPTARSSRVQRADTTADAELTEKIYQTMLSRGTTIDISSYDIAYSDVGLERVSRIVSGVINEHPELYYAEKSFKYEYTVQNSNPEQKITKLIFAYGAADDYDDAAFKNAVQQALAAANGGTSELQKAIILHDYLTINCEYDFENYNNNCLPAVSHSAYGALVNRIAVCDGYSLAYKYLLNQLGIDCYMVTSKTMAHAWNMIVLNGEYYQVDVTWGDPTWDLVGRSAHEYMLHSDDAFRTGLGKAHKDWSVTVGSEVVDYKATDTRYDSAFWTSSDAPLVFVGDDCYYVSYDNGSGKIRKGSLSKPTEAGESIHDIGSWGYVGAFSGLSLLNDRLYYNDTENICSIALDGNDKKVEYSPKIENGYKIYGSAYRQGKVRYSLHQSPNLTEKETVLEADISSGEDPVDPDDGENSGKVDGISWELSDEGALTITGSGDFTGGSDWLPAGVREKTTSIAVSVSGMTNMANMFAGFSNLESLDLSGMDMQKVTDADNMLSSCDKLTEIKTPKNCNISVALPALTNGIWVDSGNNVYKTLPQRQSTSITLTSEADTEYKITYELDGGTDATDNPSSYKASQLPITLKDPSKTGYIFAGWYTDQAFTDANKITTIESGRTGNITLYAKWEAQSTSASYKITPPTKKIYLTEETLDVTGGEILNATSGSKEDDITETMTSGFSSDAEGVSTVLVTYNKEALGDFKVLVVKAPSKLTMKLGQKLSDITLPPSTYGTWEWENAAQKPTATGEYTAYLKFTAGGVDDKYKEFGKLTHVETKIDVTERDTYAIKSPTKNVYLTGESLDLTGAEIVVKGADGSDTKAKDLEGSDLTGDIKLDTVLNTAGVEKVKAVYNGEELSFDVLVLSVPTNLTMKLDQKLEDIEKTLPPSSYGTWAWEDASVKPDAVGTKTYNLSFTPNNTTKFTARNNIPVKVEVSKRDVVISGVTVADKTYDGMAFAYTGTPTLRDTAGPVISGNVDLQATYIGTNAAGAYNDTAAPVNVGSYTLTFTLTGQDAGLYNLTGTTTYDFKINKRVLRIAANSAVITVDDEVPEPTYRINGLGLVNGERLVSEPGFNYDPGLPKPLKAGEYTIKPSNANAGDNYDILYENGLLTVTGGDAVEDNREVFTVDFSTIKVDAKNYSGKKHSISGYPLWSLREVPLSCLCRITGTTRDGEDYDESKPANFTYNGIATEFAKVYEEIAPVKCGSYTFEIDVTIDETKYNYQGSGFRAGFYVLPLQPYETKLLGVTGISDKVYDGIPVNFSTQIRNARVQSDKNDDLEDAVLEFGIKGKTAGSETEDYDVTISPLNPTAGMPSAAGSYTLWVKLIETKNYMEHVWEYPFAIKQKALTVMVDDKKVPVHVDASLLGGYTYVITDEDGNILPNDGFGTPTIAPVGDVDPTKPGEYELIASGSIAGDDYDVIFANGKLFIQAKLWDVKELNLTQNMNVPNGLSLEEIAGKYLPKTVTIYLDEEKQIEDTAAIEWDTTRPYAGSYSDKNTAQQSFKMKGTVVLPDLVYADVDHEYLLTVIVDVSVREAYAGGQALMPYADVLTGTVGEGTRVSLFTEEPDPGARIYYTVEAENPSLSTYRKLYTEPIEIKCTVTIRAVTSVYGKKDSEELRLVYYFDRNLKPGGDDDPDDPDNPGVPDDDIPTDDDGNKLPIPDGLWVTDAKGYIYTGKAIKPVVRVYDHKKRLEEKKDYTISYKNNVNAADKNSNKAPTITIKGKGNYEGTLLKTFTIAPKNINDPDVKADHLTVAFNNKQQTPAPTVTWNGKKLKNKKDYSFAAAPQMDVGKYDVKLQGIGNYTGERGITFTISNATPAAKLTVAKLPAYTYTGEAITPEPVVKSGKEVLQKGKDYTLSYEDNTEVGTASILITGAENSRFAGVKRVTFQIKEAAVLNKAKAELRFATPTIYTGKEITASDYIVTVQVKVNGVKETRTLVKDTDYKVTYQNNVKAGKATAVFEGINAYRGTLKKTFKISPYELPLDRNKLLEIKTQEAYPYMKGGSTPKPVITFDGKTLKEGTDYTLSYRNNKAAGSPATMTIKGKGNFTGSVAKGFNVEVQDLSRMTVTPADKVFKAKANNYTTTIRVYDTNGKQLTAGKDYYKKVVYAYVSDTKLVDGTEKKADTEVLSTDIIPAGTKIKVTITAAGANYQGTAVGEYKIVQSDIAKAKVTIPKQTYTGKPIEPKETDITVMINNIPVPAEEYKIISYSNNINKGTAKLTIRGQGNFGGTKTVSFKIKGKSLLGQIFG